MGVNRIKIIWFNVSGFIFVFLYIYLFICKYLKIIEIVILCFDVYCLVDCDVMVV